MPNLELYGTAGCPYTNEMREWLEWSGREFMEYDIEVDAVEDDLVSEGLPQSGNRDI